MKELYDRENDELFRSLSLVYRNNEDEKLYTLSEEKNDDDVSIITCSELCSHFIGTRGEPILIEGGPGFGKTSLAKQICKKWKENLVLTSYLVILLHLKEASVQEAETLENLLAASLADVELTKELHDEIAKIEKSKGANVLILLDGYNEFAKSADNLHIVNKLLSGNALSKATIIITSQPINWPTTLNQMQCYEITGHPQGVIDTALAELGIRKHAHIPPSVKACLNIPILLNWAKDLCKMVIQRPEDMPKSLFDFYYQMIINQYMPKYMEVFDKDAHEKIYENICNRAAHAVIGVNQQCTINQTELIAFEKGSVHSSIQDFLAAHHLHNLKVPDPDFLLSKLANNRKFSYLMMFFAGFIKQSHLTIKPEQLDKYFESIARKDKDNIIIHTMSIFCFFYELHNPCVVKHFFNKNNCKRVIIERTSPLPTPYDFYALGWCIEKSDDCTWELGFTIRHLLPNHLHGLASRSLKAVEVLNISLNPFGNEGLENVLESGTSLEKLKYLNVRGVQLKAEACELLGKWIPKLSSLEKLLIHDNCIEKGGHKLLIDAICDPNSKSKLKEAAFSNLNDKECQTLLEKSQLRRLEVWQLDSDSILAIMAGLQDNSTLEGLEIYQSEICSEHIKQACLRGSRLKCLKLNNCNIDDDIMEKVAEAVRAAPSLTSMSLDDNWISDKVLLSSLKNAKGGQLKYFADRNLLQ